MAEAVRFGVFDWIDLNPRLSSPADTYDQRLRVIEHLDRTGYWAYHVAEHHSTPLGSAPSPSLFLSSAIQRTRTLRLGPMTLLDSQQLRLKRLYPAAHYRATTSAVQVPIPRTGDGVAAARIRDLELVQMVADLVLALDGKPQRSVDITEVDGVDDTREGGAAR